MIRKGWFIIPGVQDGDRTLDEQMMGVAPALAECKNKTVLDLGCAEGLIGREFARAGAASVSCTDSLFGHLEVAREQCREFANCMTFRQADLHEFARNGLERENPRRFDIVLSLGVCHKLHDPELGIRFSARSTGKLCLVRMCARGEAKDGILRSKHRRSVVCNVHQIMEEEGLWLDRVLAGPREETVEWWRRR